MIPRAMLARPAARPALCKPIQTAAPRLTVRFGPLGPVRPHLVRLDQRGFRGIRPTVVRAPWPFVPKLPAEGRRMRLARLDQRGFRGRVLVCRPPRLFVRFGPTGPPRAHLAVPNERGFRGRVLKIGPPIKYAFAQTPARERPILCRLDRRERAGWTGTAEPPRQRVIFAPGALHPPQLVHLDQRGFRGRVIVGGAQRFNAAPPSTERTYTAEVIEAGYEGVLLP